MPPVKSLLHNLISVSNSPTVTKDKNLLYKPQQSITILKIMKTISAINTPGKISQAYYN